MTGDRPLRWFAIVALLAAILLLLVPVPGARAAAGDRVDRLSQRQLEREARHVARNGGIRCHTVGVGARCATPYMRRLVRELVTRRFRPHGPDAVAWAVCVAGRESGFNPAAVSATDDHGAGQLNRPSHPWIDTARIAWRTSASPTGWASDPVYSVAVFAQLADGGRNRGPWEAGAAYHCPRRHP